jgi:hypothetical protein
MKSGIRMGRVPQSDDIVFFDGGDRAQVGRWSADGGHVGAVDVYTNTQLLSQFSPIAPLVFNDDWEFEDKDRFRNQTYPLFAVRFTLTGEARKKALYLAQGLGGMWSALQRVRRIAGVPTDFVDWTPAWSFRELYRIVSTLGPPDPNSKTVVTGLAIIRRFDAVNHKAPLLRGQKEMRSMREAIRLATL